MQLICPSYGLLYKRFFHLIAAALYDLNAYNGKATCCVVGDLEMQRTARLPPVTDALFRVKLDAQIRLRPALDGEHAPLREGSFFI